MSTYREAVYMCLDLLKQISDDTYYTQEHIVYLLDKYRAFILKKTYSDIKKEIPESNFQTITVNLARQQGFENDACSNSYLKSINQIPNILPITKPRVSSLDFLDGDITYVSKERMKFVGNNKWLKNIIYCTKGPDGYLYLKSSNPQAYYLTNVMVSGIFESPSELISEDQEGTVCDVLDKIFPLEEGLVSTVIELIVKDLTSSVYKPEDSTNDAADDLSNITSFIRRNMKSDLTKAIEG